MARRVAERNARAAKRAADAADPDVKDVLTFMYTDTKSETVPPEFAKVEVYAPAPEVEARRRRNLLQGRAARGARRRNDARQPRRLLRRGCRRLRRRVQGDEGHARDLRPPPRLQHADQRSLHLRNGLRRGDAGPAAGGRADVLRLRADVVGPDQQPGRQVALYERRTDRSAAGHPRLGRQRQGLRRAAFADARSRSSATSPASTWSIRRRRPTRRAC